MISMVSSPVQNDVIGDLPRRDHFLLTVSWYKQARTGVLDEIMINSTARTSPKNQWTT